MVDPMRVFAADPAATGTPAPTAAPARPPVSGMPADPASMIRASEEPRVGGRR